MVTPATMNRPIGVIILITSCLCGCKKDSCPAAKKTASTEVVSALNEANDELGRLKRDQETANSNVALIPANEKQFEADLKLFEQSMGCLVYTDCCVRLGKMSLLDRAIVGSSGLNITEVHEDERRNLPAGLGLKKFTELMGQDGTGLNNSDPMVVQQWCVSVREEITKIRRNAPVAWKAASEEANQRVAAARAALAAHADQSTLLESWAAAVKESKAYEISAGLAEGSESFRRARTAMESYQRACN